MRPAFDPSMSDGCSVPPSLRRVLPILSWQCVACHPFCVKHDEAYYNGGTEVDRERADAALRDAITPVVGEAWALEWYNAVRLFGGRHWGAGRTWNGRLMWQATPEAP